MIIAGHHGIQPSSTKPFEGLFVADGPACLVGRGPVPGWGWCSLPRAGLVTRGKLPWLSRDRSLVERVHHAVRRGDHDCPTAPSTRRVQRQRIDRVRMCSQWSLACGVTATARTSCAAAGPRASEDVRGPPSPARGTAGPHDAPRRGRRPGTAGGAPGRHDTLIKQTTNARTSAAPHRLGTAWLPARRVRSVHPRRTVSTRPTPAAQVSEHQPTTSLHVTPPSAGRPP